ncbi:DUF7619 domain-containing protein [Xanthocytophaga flava]|uniref:DUF7619 domain-containing protein n=1 Tax=Xanthocytophaga flava TaxID=3048013 RepID=UPI0028D1F8B5|nr:6-bladed beta-propeller [Xanthocytophaga flavus]MDJ1471118.1 6-bladed beta-propeller [Xanthocytophaga flavus]
MKQHYSLVYFLVLFFVFPLAGRSQSYFFNHTIGSPISFEYPFKIITDKKGNLYVVNASNWYITKFTAKGEIVLRFGKTGTETGSFSGTIIDIAVDDDENIYVLDNSRVQMFNAKGEFVKVISVAFRSYYNGIAVDDQKNIYLAVISTLTNANEIHKLDQDGNILLKFGSTGTADEQFQRVWKLCVNSKGEIYTIDSGHTRIQKFDSTGRFLLTFGERGSGNGQFYNPQALTTDAEGNVWVVDTQNYRIQQFSSSGNFIISIGSFGVGDKQFSIPNGICVDPLGTVYVSDYITNKVQRFLPNGKLIETYGFRGTTNGQLQYMYGTRRNKAGDFYISTDKFIAKYNQKGILVKEINSLGTQNSEFTSPSPMAIDAQNNLYVCDNSNRLIQKFDTTGNFLFAFGKEGTGAGEFYSLQGIEIDPLGNIYVTDPRNKRIQKFDSKGRFLLQFGNPDLEEFYPEAIAIDKLGNVYVTDTQNNAVFKFDSTGRMLKKIGSTGTDPGHFNYPSAIKIDQQGNLYIGDRGNYRIQILDRDGEFITQFGSQGYGREQFGSVSDLDISPEGDLYVSDALNYRITAFATAPLTANVIRGKVFIAQNTDCIQDSTEIGMPRIVVLAEPGPYYTVTDSTGSYSLQVDTGKYQIMQILPSFTSNTVVTSVCPQKDSVHTVSFSERGQTISDVNFANQFKVLLPYLSCEVSSNRRRRCELSTTKIVYANKGQGKAEQVKIYVKLPQYVVLRDASKSYEIDKDSNYVFSIPVLNPNESGSITIVDYVSCIRGITGLTQCTKAWITPFNQVVEAGEWDNSDIMLTGKCIENGRVQMIIKNVGQAAMADSSEFRIFLDTQLAFRKNYKLAKGDSLVLKVPVNGKTVRLEADQRPDHPRKSQTNLTIEGCVASTSSIVSKGFVNALPQDDEEPEVSINCLPIVDSYDPNDKQVSPQGTAVDHYTPTRSEFKYTIRFQNTGTDTAYRITVIDTLSEKLDFATMKMGVVSHKYLFSVSGKEKPILTWFFPGINLPDSTRDQKGSNGFIEFSIKPKGNLPEKTQIENFGDIFFDYNDPVRTNTTMNVLYDIPKVINSANQLDDSIIDKVTTTEPDALKGKLTLHPNPTQSLVWIQLLDVSVRIEQIRICNLLGQQQTVNSSFTDNQNMQINMQGWSNGMYLIHIQTNKGTSVQRVVVQ